MSRRVRRRGLGQARNIAPEPARPTAAARPTSQLGRLAAVRAAAGRAALVVCLALLTLLRASGNLFAADVPGMPDELTPERVRQSIDRGVQYLRSQQREDGAWPEYGNYFGGVTSLCTLAMLNAGVRVDDPAIQKALKRLEVFRPQTTYATALQTLVFCQVNPRKYMTTHIQRNVLWLERTQIKFGPARGAWTYFEEGGTGDGSNSQFALLALNEAERAGAEVAPGTWDAAREYWKNLQRFDGAWGYKFGGDPWGSMTCAGIAAMIITSDRVRQPAARVEGTRILCCQKGDSGSDISIQSGLRWLGANFTVARNPGYDLWRFYYLYALERVGRLTNQRFIGDHDWYREGAAQLVADQDPISYFWKGSNSVEEGRPDITTAMAILFLAKGRRPILLAKLEHTLPDDWNVHRSDVDNLTQYVEKRWSQQLTWQVMNLDHSSVEDLLQAPVLFYAGSLNPLPRQPAQRQALAEKLRNYLDRGGFLLAEAQCNGAGFDQGFRELMTLVFPEPEYRLRLLEPEHPIWRAEAPVPLEYRRPLWGIDAGCRTCVVYAPPVEDLPSLSCLWELSRPGRAVHYEPSVQRQIDAGLLLGTNILVYATNRELKGKEETFRTTTEEQSVVPYERGTLYVASLKHPGGCNAAPRALVNLLQTAAADLHLRVHAEQRFLDITSPALFEHHLVFMHGRNSFHLLESERRQLKEYLERGGMLFADAICTSPAFAESFRREMSAIFPDRKLEKIAVDDPLLTTTYGGFDLKTVGRRDPPAQGSLTPVVRKTAPDLEGIRIDDRWAVVFSQYDVSCALEKSSPPDCRGYTQDDAARIGLNVLLYSMQQ